MLKELIRELVYDVKRPLDDVISCEIQLSHCRDFIVFIRFDFPREKSRFACVRNWPASVAHEMRAKYLFPVLIRTVNEIFDL